ncbi:MAG TPA: bifunctional DNA primase/polymerase [Actinocrinis sp.]|nr:bifunctional DNA primase/polymerase [Actinocrinis sp.]
MAVTGTDADTGRERPRARLIPAMRRRREAPDPLDAFVARGFAVVPAAAPLGPACSCSRVGCPSPGRHPLSYGWRTEASADPAQVEVWRTRLPGGNFASPTGTTHDVLDIPAAAGEVALAALLASAQPVGPVALCADGDRYLFFTLPRVRALGPDGLDEDEWWPCELDAHPDADPDNSGVRWHTRGSYVLVPPALSVTGGRARWIHGDQDALPDPVRLLTALVDACDRTA